MKNASAPASNLEFTPSVGVSAAPVETNDLITAPAAPATVRILLSLDVPVAALAAIEADWAMVSQTQEDAPDYAAPVVAAALARLQEHAVQVGGVAVVEHLENPFQRWLRAA